jgi:hypothetical protein
MTNEKLIQKATDFLKTKGMITDSCTRFIITGDFGEITLNSLLSEFVEYIDNERESMTENIAHVIYKGS